MKDQKKADLPSRDQARLSHEHKGTSRWRQHERHGSEALQYAAGKKASDSDMLFYFCSSESILVSSSLPYRRVPRIESK